MPHKRGRQYTITQLNKNVCLMANGQKKLNVVLIVPKSWDISGGRIIDNVLFGQLTDRTMF
jgi:hypothetical protein